MTWQCNLGFHNWKYTKLENIRRVDYGLKPDFSGRECDTCGRMEQRVKASMFAWRYIGNDMETNASK